jgi:hypothetical protein
VKRAEFHGYPPKLLNDGRFLSRRPTGIAPVGPRAADIVNGAVSYKRLAAIF